MFWLVVSIAAYFLIASEVILDKFLLSSGKVSHPAIYAFYSGMLSLFTLVLFPFGFYSISLYKFSVSMLAGIIFIYGILSLFFAFKKSDASQVIPVTVVTIPIITYLFSIVILQDRLNMAHLVGVGILIFGGLLVSLDFSSKKTGRFFKGFWQALLAGTLLALAYTMFKYLYASDTGRFINMFIWTRMGLFVGAASLLLFPAWRKIIFLSLKKGKKPQKEHYQSSTIFIATKILGGFGSILHNKAISMGNVTIVNALVSLEYAFVFILEAVLFFWFPSIFKKDGNPMHILQKIVAVILIMLGVYLVSYPQA